MAANYICATCGVQYATSPAPPDVCPICADDRQYINANGQTWTTLTELSRTHHNHFTILEPNLAAIYSVPRVAIGQRGLLVQTPAGNVLWDCTPLLDATSITMVRALGGIAAIAVSHPHLSSTLVEWSQAFDDAPIYWHAADRAWVMRPQANYVFWENEKETVVDGIDLIRCGGHFPGSAVLHWRGGAAGKGVLFTGDTMMVGPDGHVSFMYSYPNLIPLSGTAVRHIGQQVAPLAFDRIYGAWKGSVIATNGQQVVQSSVARYLQAMR